jgi:hypothetical protein
VRARIRGHARNNRVPTKMARQPEGHGTRVFRRLARVFISAPEQLARYRGELTRRSPSAGAGDRSARSGRIAGAGARRPPPWHRRWVTWRGTARRRRVRPRSRHGASLQRVRAALAIVRSGRRSWPRCAGESAGLGRRIRAAADPRLTLPILQGFASPDAPARTGSTRTASHRDRETPLTRGTLGASIPAPGWGEGR